MRVFAGRWFGWEADVIKCDHGHYLKAHPILDGFLKKPSQPVGTLSHRTLPATYEIGFTVTIY